MADQIERQADFTGAALSPDGSRVVMSFADGAPVSIPRDQLNATALALMALVQPEPVMSGQAASVTAFNISWWQMRPADAGGATLTFDVGPAQISFVLEPQVLRDMVTGAAGMTGQTVS